MRLGTRRFGMTGKVVAKADRQVDPYTHIDHIREQIFDYGEEFEKLWQQINSLRTTINNKRDWTESGVWRVVRAKLDEEAIDWVKWGVRAALAGVGTAFLTFLIWMGKLAWRGLS